MEYKAVESILAELHGVTPDDRGALRSRLRMLRDIGVPAVEKPGKGARVEYRFPDLWEMRLALLLEQFGLPPAQVKLVLAARVGWQGWYDAMREHEKQTRDGADIWVHVRWVSLNLEQGTPAPVILMGPLDDIVRDIKIMDLKGAFKTAVIGLINLSKLTRECDSAILKHAH
jgi:hypothetical protein